MKTIIQMKILQRSKKGQPTIQTKLIRLPHLNYIILCSSIQMRHVINKVKDYWHSDTSFITLSVMLGFMVFIMPVLIEGGIVDILFLNILFLILYFIGIFSSEDKWNIYLATFLFVAHIILLLIRFDDSPNEYYLLERMVGLVNWSG